MTLAAWVTRAVVVCVLSHRGSHLPAEERETVADAFMASVQPHVPLTLLMAVGYAESRWNPHGSQLDRNHGMWGVMQLFAPELRCLDRRGRDRVHRCSSLTRERRDRMLDPVVNIRRGALLLERRWQQNHRSGPRWVGSYYFGSVPAAATDVARFERYVTLVRSAEAIVSSWMYECRSAGN